MSDQFTEVTHESWFSRLTGSIKSVLFGVVLFIVAFPLLWWNEGRAVATAKSLKMGAETVVSISSDEVTPGMDGKLVHTSGLASSGEILSDSELGVSAQGIKLRREVEMFQWKEESSSKKKKKAGGGSKTETTYSYKTAWSEGLIDSSSFKRPDGHQNPTSMPYSTRIWGAENVTLGAFNLSQGLVDKISAWEELRVNEVPAGAAAGMRVENGLFYIGADPTNPQVGDVRISYETVGASTVSVVAQLSGTNLVADHSTGRAIEMLDLGMHTADAMFKSAISRNKMLTWLLRLAGFLAMAIGIAMVVRPIAVFGDVIPLIGTLLRGGIALVAGGIAAVLSLLVIAVAWVVYRPLIGISLLVLAIGLFVGARMLAKKKEPKLPPLPTE